MKSTGCLAPFFMLHWGHKSCRFLSPLMPPNAVGIMWSMWYPHEISFSQHAHFPRCKENSFLSIPGVITPPFARFLALLLWVFARHFSRCSSIQRRRFSFSLCLFFLYQLAFSSASLSLFSTSHLIFDGCLAIRISSYGTGFPLFATSSRRCGYPV